MLEIETIASVISFAMIALLLDQDITIHYIPWIGREAAKMAFLLPWLLPRLILGLLSLTILAIMSSFAALGWQVISVNLPDHFH